MLQHTGNQSQTSKNYRRTYGIYDCPQYFTRTSARRSTRSGGMLDGALKTNNLKVQSRGNRQFEIFLW